MEPKATSTLILTLRITSFLALVACVITLGLNKVSVYVDIFKLEVDVTKVTFNDVTTYRYVFYAALIGACYAFLQLPFAVYLATKGKRICWPEFDFYGDKKNTKTKLQVISYLLATATGAGLAFSCEFKSFLDKLFELITNEEADVGEARHQYDNFLSRGIIASSVLCLGFVCMVILSAFSSSERLRRES
ncbi:hypothetical protein Tsubulata_039487 [Turnera subulata]|uniref:CASP-like protein n=1 Tax=Turnera subulata TaxID=218843 RepID=A0A9Q0J3A9_9ROSI|nr:hypothetical protein Tsubulata_039487 [Turnera subulata]